MQYMYEIFVSAKECSLLSFLSLIEYCSVASPINVQNDQSDERSEYSAAHYPVCHRRQSSCSSEINFLHVTCTITTQLN